MKRLKLFLVLTLLVSSSVVWADEITIADGTGTTDYVPIWGHYADNVQHTQSIYPASMLEDLPVGCTITKLTYYLSGVTDANLTSTFEFKLGETSSESFASAAFDNSPTTVVFTGNVVTTSNPVVIEFDKPYIYNGGNLLIDESNVAAGNWKTTNFYAISHTGGSVYYRDESSTTTKYDYLPKVTIEYSGGQVATCPRVKNVAAAPTANSAFVSWTAGGTESQWVVAYKAASDTIWSEMTVNSDSTTISGLNPQTAYNVKVKAVCTPGTDESAYSGEVIFKTTYAAPYFEDFSTTDSSLPADWSNLSGAAFTSNPPTTTTGVWSMTTNGLDKKHYKMNIYNNYQYWLVTPNIYLDNRDFNLVFKLAATDYGDGNPPGANEPGSDDEFIVIVSTDDGATWTEANATKWGTGDGYDYQFSDVSNTGDEITVPLSAYKNGTVKIAFYGASYQSNADFDVHVGDVSIEVASSCAKVTGLNVAGITSTSANVDWTPIGSESSWVVAYCADGETSWTELSASAHPFTISGLNPNSPYKVKVKTVCSATEESNYTSEKSFRTACSAFTTLPYVCGFENEELEDGNSSYKLPQCWSRVTDNTSSSLYPYSNSTSYSHTGSRALYYLLSSSTYQVAVMGEIDTTAIAVNALRMKFFARMVSPSHSGAVKVGAMTDPTDYTTFTELGTVQISSATMTQFIVLLSDYTPDMGSYLTLAVERQSLSSTSASIYVDDLTLEVAPSCVEVDGEANITDIDEKSAVVNISDATATDWQVAYGTVADPEQCEIKDANGQSYSVIGLEPRTTYYVYVRRNCGSEFSAWSTVKSFTTASTVINAPFVCGFESIDETNVWESRQATGTNALTIGSASDAVKDGSSALYVSNDGSTYTYGVTNTSASYYYVTMRFEEKVYNVSFDWQCTGGENNYDYASVMLLETAIDLTSLTNNSFPTGLETFISQKSKVGNNSNPWNTYSGELDMHGRAGVYKFVVAWRNDGSNGDPTPFAIDNISIIVNSCPRPEISVSSVTDSLILSGTHDVARSFEYVVATSSNFDPDDTSDSNIISRSNKTSVKNLTPNTIYYYTGRALCDDTTYSEWADIKSVRTPCAAPATPLFQEGFESITSSGVTPDCWSMGWIFKPSKNTEAYPFNTTSTHYNGARGFQLVDQRDSSVSYLSTPLLPIDSAGKYLVHIAVNRSAASTSYSDEGIQLWLTQTEGDTTGGVMLGYIHRIMSYSPVEDAAGWYEYEYPIMVAGNYHLTVVGISNYGHQTSFDDLQVKVIPTCMKPADVVCSDVTENSVDVSWTDRANATQWAVKVEQNGQVVNTVISNSTDITVSGLMANTVYQVSVAAICDGTDTTEYTSPLSFRTRCSAVSLPYYEDFESYANETVMPCWDNSASTTTTVTDSPQNVWGVYKQNGSNTMRMYNYYVKSGTAVINSPAIIIPAAGAIMTFDYASDANCGSWFVQVSSDGGENFTNMAEFDSTGSVTLNNYAEIDLSDYANQNIIVRFFANATWGSGAIYVDNIAIVVTPSCRRVSAEIANVTSVSADVTVHDICAWQIAYGVQGTAVENMTIVSVPVAQLTYTLTQLSDATAYDLYVRRDCGSEQSEWSNLVQFRTIAIPTQLPYFTDFENAADNQKWQMADGTGDNVFIIGNDTNAVNRGANALYVTDGSSYFYNTGSSSRSFAYRTLEFEAKRYTVSFDWQCTGGEGTSPYWDYGKVMLYPASVEIVGGTGIQYSSASFPQGMIPFDPDNTGKISLVAGGWQHYEGVVDMTERAGVYNFVALWNNDGSQGAQSPLAIDNLSITEAQTSFLVTFVDYDGQVLSSDTMEYDSMPEIPELPGRPATAEWKYEFNRWSPYISRVTADVTYTAVYDSVVNDYSVKWFNWDGTLLVADTVAYGTTPEYTGATPTKEAEEQFEFMFAGWMPAITSVTGDVNYYAVYDTVYVYSISISNVTYTISGMDNDHMTIEKASFNENNLAQVDFDITYSPKEEDTPGVNDFFNYKHKIDVPDKMTDDNGNTYTITAVLADAFDGNNLTDTVRVNVPVESIEGVSHDKNVIIRLDGTPDRMHCNGNDYYCSKAYKVATEDAGITITITKRPFGEQTLNVTSKIDKEMEIEESHIFRTLLGVRWNYDENGIIEQDGTNSHNLIATLEKDEVTITPVGINTIRVANNATFSGRLDLSECEELTFQFATSDDEDARAYPDCRFTEDIALGDNTKVNVEMSLNNQEYYYFSLPFDCNIDNIKAVDSVGNIIQRAYSIDAAVNSLDELSHYYVLLEWNENKYIDSTTNAYTALNRQATKMEKNKGYVIVIVESYESWAANKDTVLTAMVTFTANGDYRKLVSQADVTIDTENSDQTRTNPFSGWNLVGNPYYNNISSSQYSYNQYVQKIFHDNGDSAVVRDFASEIPALSTDIKPFEAVFIQHSGVDDLVVSSGTPVQHIHHAPAALPEYITITISTNGKMIDRTTIINNVDASDKYVMGEDLVKGHLSSNEIFTRYDNTDFSFNKMNIGEGTKVIPVGVRVTEAGDYTISLSEELTNFKVGNVMLHDKTLGTYYNLSNGESETLHLEKGATNKRLELIVTDSDDIDGKSDGMDGKEEVKAYVKDGVVTVCGIEDNAVVTVSDAAGRMLHSSVVTSNQIYCELPAPGVYMITMRGEKTITVKVVY